MGLASLRSLYLNLRLYLANHLICHLPSHAVRLFYYRRMMRYQVGEGSSILLNARFDAAGHLTIGRNSTVNERCRLDSRGGLTIGDNVSISGEVAILTAEHDIHTFDFEGMESPVTLEDHVFVGTRATILPGVTVGRGAVVAAGAVVCKNVPPFTIVGGVPARPIGQRRQDLAYEVRYRRFLH